MLNVNSYTDDRMLRSRIIKNSYFFINCCLLLKTKQHFFDKIKFWINCLHTVRMIQNQNYNLVIQINVYIYKIWPNIILNQSDENRSFFYKHFIIKFDLYISFLNSFRNLHLRICIGTCALYKMWHK